MIQDLHSLLRRQLKRHFDDLDQIPSQIRDFLETVNDAYRQFDDDRIMLERSLELSSQELLQANADLASEKERLAVTLHSIGDGVITTNTEERILFVNRVAEQLIGLAQEDALGRSVDEVFHSRLDAMGEIRTSSVSLALMDGRIVHRTESFSLMAHDGTKRPIEESAAPIRDRQNRVVGAVLVFRDISAKLQIELERMRAAKLQSLGVLAGGIAHDFNNLLTLILGNVSLARHIFDGDEAVEDLLEKTLVAGRRAKSLTGQLLTFSKGGSPIRETAAIDEMIRESADFVLSGSSVSVELAFADDLHPVNIDTGQINQVFNNLLINAVQAMPTGGSIRVEAKNVDLQNGQIPSLPAGRYVKISVRDEGMGIVAEQLEKVFDPYYTTKDDGNGLGLATTYSIIKNHKGSINVESEVDVGTTFYIYLPSSDSLPLPKETNTIPEAVEAPSESGHGRILMMDDDALVCTLVGHMLEVLGYEPTMANDGESAIELYCRAMAEGNPFDVVIIDLTVPGGMGGSVLIEALLKIDPQIKAVVASGYVNSPVMLNYQTYGFSGALAKPYDVEELGAVLQGLIRP